MMLKAEQRITFRKEKRQSAAPTKKKMPSAKPFASAQIASRAECTEDADRRSSQAHIPREGYPTLFLYNINIVTYIEMLVKPPLDVQGRYRCIPFILIGLLSEYGRAGTALRLRTGS